ncbi:HpcH/HpaI aldolase/citrate lyase family protein [Saccharopolyspora terrae]|uniref:HpcH/HpaI aldolase/citrate lyase family protein n=1 Tax=Saccharopolyspora terrae TaxID=2530384 RepID=UPI001F43F889|nr:CoA ester lyase [Saccharopolyspora terrae]
MPTSSPPRSLLAVPADNPRLLSSALRRPADALMPDLEDAVAPAAKEHARAEVVRFLTDPATVDTTLLVRVNDPASEAGRLDLAALAPNAGRLAGVVVPKSSRQSVAAVREILNVPVLALIETAVGVEEAYGIARQDHVVGVLFGSVDYTAELASRGGLHVSELGWAKSRVVNAAAAGGVWAVAGPRTVLDDEPGLRGEAETDRSLGFAGKLCVHPGQLAVVNAAFAPSSEQRAWARRVFDALESDGAAGVLRVDGQMIDRPLIEQARSVLSGPRAVVA